MAQLLLDEFLAQVVWYLQMAPIFNMRCWMKIRFCSVVCFFGGKKGGGRQHVFEEKIVGVVCLLETANYPP